MNHGAGDVLKVKLDLGVGSAEVYGIEDELKVDIGVGDIPTRLTWILCASAHSRQTL